ncbi:MAG: hypothetical protein LBS29_05535, partial [Endomicrobium sp.]|nr:hypothetical protein [Endomicrobium sp.]
MSKCFNLFKAFKQYLFSSLLLTITLTPSLLLAQDINIVAPTTYTVAGNGVLSGSNNGWVKPVNQAPWESIGVSADSVNNSITIISPVTNTVYGGLNYPFVEASVGDSQTGSLKPLIEASSNTVYLYNDVGNKDVWGAYSYLTNASGYTSPADNIINSTFSFCNNRIEVSSYSNINTMYSAYLRLYNYDSASVTLNSSFYFDNNYVVFNSSANVQNDVFAACLDLSAGNSGYKLGNISLSSNTIEIKENIYGPDQQIYVVWSRFTGSIENLYITNNKIILSSKENLTLYNADLFAFNNISGDVKNQFVYNNTLQIEGLKGIIVKSINNFDTFVFNLPNNVISANTILTLSSQPYDINVDANKLTISNYDHFTSPLSINLIDAYGTYG